MKVYKYPGKSQWEALAKRPELEQQALGEAVRDILNNVRTNKDSALKKYSEKFDQVVLNRIEVTQSEIEIASNLISPGLKTAIMLAIKNIATFHSSQKDNEKIIETTKGVQCWRKSVAIDKVGLYIPGGSAPLFSTILMLGIPAKLAGCKRIVV